MEFGGNDTDGENAKKMGENCPSATSSARKSRTE